MVVASAIAFCIAAPFAKVQMAPIAAFIPGYQSALVVSDLATAALLYAHFASLRSRALLVLASGYLFTAVAAFAHLLTFPGLFSPTGLLGAGPQTTAWLYMFWHGGFPFFVMAYSVLASRERAGGASVAGTARAAIFLAAAAAIGLAALFAALASVGHPLLPPIMADNHYTPYMVTVVATVWITSVLALFEVWRRRSRAALDLWLMVVLCGWIFDVALSAVLNAGRFDLGFYGGRLYGLAAANVVLMMLIAENAKMHMVLARSRDRAVAAERAKGTFLATMSHEIRTPLNGVIGMLELLSLTRLDAEQRSILATVRQSGESLMRIINDILDLSRIEAGKLDLRPEPASVRALVKSVCDVYSGNASMKGLLLAGCVDERIQGAHILDSLRVQQVLNNLVSNAIKFTSSGSVELRVDLVHAAAEADALRFSVKDSGAGLTPDEQSRLFQPFTQSGSPQAGGTGLGLSICRRLARLMGASLEMQSVKGHGTTVSFTLPAARAPLHSVAPGPQTAPLASRGAPPVEAARAAGSLVLVVDDHPINRMLLAKQLESLGHAGQSIESGLEAMEIWRRGGIALVITDCDMPGMDGYELARRIRAFEAAQGRARTPIVAWTANALEGEAEKCLACGMDDYLVKPTRRGELAAMLARWMEPRPLHEGDAIDRSQLAEVTGGDAATEQAVLAEFLRCTRDDAADLARAVAASDIALVTRIAHRLKGAGAAVGALGLRRVCEEIESAGRGDDWPSIRRRAGAVEIELRRIGSQLQLPRAARTAANLPEP